MIYFQFSPFSNRVIEIWNRAILPPTFWGWLAETYEFGDGPISTAHPQICSSQESYEWPAEIGVATVFGMLYISLCDVDAVRLIGLYPNPMQLLL